ncbi:MAG: hypothetical protein JJE17_00490 [Peptostreptococcaceae bacterium]|nr:hypothetical protein [Peptostreptococcaceae bacterium]
MNANTINKIKAIREVFWPVLEPLEEIDIKLLKKEDINNNDFPTMIKYVEKYKDSENERNKQVETKAALFIGSFGVATAVLLSLIKDIVYNDAIDKNILTFLIVSIICITIIYLCKSIWYSIKALERRNYNTFGFPSFLYTDSTVNNPKIIETQYNQILKNQPVINLKVDYMVMAQEYFKRVIIALVGICFLVFLNYINEYEILKLENLQFNRIIIKPEYLIYFNLVSIIILFILVIIIFAKLSKIKKNNKN